MKIANPSHGESECRPGAAVWKMAWPAALGRHFETVLAGVPIAATTTGKTRKIPTTAATAPAVRRIRTPVPTSGATGSRVRSKLKVHTGDRPIVLEAGGGSVRVRPGTVSGPDAKLTGTPPLVLGVLTGELAPPESARRRSRVRGRSEGLAPSATLTSAEPVTVPADKGARYRVQAARAEYRVGGGRSTMRVEED